MLEDIHTFSKTVINAAGESEEVITFSAIGSTGTDKSQWVEGTMSTSGDPWLEMPAKLFYTGTHRGKPWTTRDLDLMVEQFTEPKGELDWDVPGQLDHSESARDTTGHLRKVWRNGQDLWGVVRHVGKEAVQKAKNGLWRKLSLGVFARSKKIREYTITPFPQLTGAALFSQTQIHESEQSMPETAEGTTKTQDTPKAPATPAPEPVENFAELKAQLMAQFAAKTEALEARLTESEKKNEGLEQIVRFTAIAAEVDTFSEAGKTLPAMRETELALAQSLSEEQMELFRAYKAATPKLVSEEVLGDQDPDHVDEFKRSKTDDGEAEAKAKELAAKYK